MNLLKTKKSQQRTIKKTHKSGTYKYNVEFSNNEFSKSEFHSTPLTDINFRSSNLNKLKLDISNLKGIIVNEIQALILLEVLGVRVK